MARAQTITISLRFAAMSAGNALLLLLGAALLSFILFSVAPGDPARVILGPQASQESVAALRERLGLNDALPTQAWNHLCRIASLDFGTSISTGRPVLPNVMEKFSITATIGLQAALISLVLSYGVNFLVFRFPGSRFVLGVFRAGVLMPVFLLTVLGALLVGLFLPGVSLSSSGAKAGPFTQILPSILASLYPLAVMTTVLRQGVAEGLSRPPHRAARALGLEGWRLFHRSLFRPALVPWLAAWINQISLVFFASLVLEVILSIPGSGNLLLVSVQNRDYPTLQGLILVNATFFILISFLAEFAYPALDPRTRK